jgi:hypothetical protein
MQNEGWSYCLHSVHFQCLLFEHNTTQTKSRRKIFRLNLRVSTYTYVYIKHSKINPKLLSYFTLIRGSIDILYRFHILDLLRKATFLNTTRRFPKSTKTWRPDIYILILPQFRTFHNASHERRKKKHLYKLFTWFAVTLTCLSLLHLAEILMKLRQGIPLEGFTNIEKRDLMCCDEIPWMGVWFTVL